MGHAHPAQQLEEVKTWLLDTGPLVAALDAKDPAHQQVDELLRSFRGVLMTTGAVLTEAFHLLRHARDGAERLVDFIEDAGISVIDIFTPEDLRRITQLMDKYAGRPMDFADGSLVLIAEDKGCDDILTLDWRGFTVFRFGRNRRFKLLLGRN